MKKKWKLKTIEESVEVIERKELRKIFEEVAEIIYLDLCQLQKDSSLNSLNNEQTSLEKAA